MRKKTGITLFGTLFLVIALFAVYGHTSHTGKKRFFYFQEIGSEKIITEVRYIPQNPSQGDLRLYIDELLLGSQLPRLRPLFSRGTTVRFLSVQGGTLFVDLSDDVILQLSDSPDITDGIALFEKNIKRNFKNIRYVELFIGGKSVYNYSEKEKEKR